MDLKVAYKHIHDMMDRLFPKPYYSFRAPHIKLYSVAINQLFPEFSKQSQFPKMPNLLPTCSGNSISSKSYLVSLPLVFLYYPYILPSLLSCFLFIIKHIYSVHCIRTGHNKREKQSRQSLLPRAPLGPVRKTDN